MKAILPSAGYATRMWPLTEDKPKALLEVNGKPIIEYIIEKVCLIDDIDEIIIVTNDKFYGNFLRWNESFRCEVLIKILNDGTKSNEERLGSLGDVNYVLEKKKINEDFLIINSDNLFSFDLLKMHEYFKLRGAPVVSVYNVGSLETAGRMGSLRFDDDNRVIFFKEKDANVQSSLCSIGIYFFTRETIDLIRKYLEEGNSADRTGDFIEWLYRRKDIYGYVFDSADDKWFDIGDLKSYEEARRVWRDSQYVK